MLDTLDIVVKLHLTNAKKYKLNQSWHRVIKEVKKAYNSNFYKVDRSGIPLYWYSGLGYFNLGK